MVLPNLIAVEDFCNNCHIELAFVDTLQQKGLIEILTIEETAFIEIGQLQQLEKLINFYYGLDINLEGIETILHLLQRIDSMHEEINRLQNKLRLYEKSGR